MTIKKGQEIDLFIEQAAFGGKGLARVQGFAIFVEQAIPLDRVKARIVKKKKNYAEARVLELLEPSPDRIQAACTYSGFCGGCKWQFVNYEKQLQYKHQQVREALEHIGLVEDSLVHPTLASPVEFGYRNKMEFSCADRRWVLPGQLGCQDIDTSMALGLHVPGTFYKVLDIDACLLQPKLGNQILSDVRDYIKKSQLPVYGLKSHQGFWRFLVLRHSAYYDQWMVNIVTSAQQRPCVQPLADHLLETYPNVVSVINNVTSRKAGVAVGEYEQTLAGSSTIVDRIGAYEFELSSNSFFQTNTKQAQCLYDTVMRYAGLTGTQTVLDLYCGAGTISIYMASKAKEVIGFEMMENAVSDARKNCVRNGVKNCSFISGDIRNCLPDLDRKPDVIVIDPPRAGMHQDVVKQILNLSVPKMVYVSCNPATMARDIGLLKEFYDVIEVQPVDMFPHTFHIESVALLKKRNV